MIPRSAPIGLLLGAAALYSAGAALAAPQDGPAAPPAAEAAPPPAPAAPASAAPAAPPVAAPGPAAASPRPPAATPAPAPPKVVLERVPRVIGLAVGWGWNTVNHLPVSKDGKKTQPHGLSLFGDFLWQVSGIGGGWPSWLGFMTGFLYFPGASARRDAFALEYGILVKHGLFPGFVLRPFAAYGLGAAQAWVTGIESRGIGHVTRLSLGTDIIVSPRFTLTFELLYKIVNMPTFATAPGTVPGPYDFHTLSALFGGQFEF